MTKGIWLDAILDEGSLVKHRDYCGDITQHVQLVGIEVVDGTIIVTIGFIDSDEGEEPLRYEFPMDSLDLTRYKDSKNPEKFIADWAISQMSSAVEDSTDMFLADWI